MTSADTETTSKRRTPVRTEAAGSLTEGVVDVAERAVRLARSAAETSLRVTDTVVLGSFDVAQEWIAGTPMASLTNPPVRVARETWISTRDGLRELVATV